VEIFATMRLTLARPSIYLMIL